MNPRTRKALWILFGVLLVVSLLLAGPAHHVLHDGVDEFGSCDMCHVASPEAPRFEPLLFWLAEQPIEVIGTVELVFDHLLAEQGRARAPPEAG